MQHEVANKLSSKELELEGIDQSQFMDGDDEKRIVISGLINKIIEALKENYEKKNGKNLNECLEKFEISVVAITKVKADLTVRVFWIFSVNPHPH